MAPVTGALNGTPAMRLAGRPQPMLRGMSRRAGWMLGAVVLLAPVLAVMWAALLPVRGGFTWDGLVALLLVASVAEEIVFRAGLQDWLERRPQVSSMRSPVAVAIGVSSAVFALCHVAGQGTWWALASVLPSLALGALYKAGGLRVAIACHAWFNLCFVLAAWPR